MGRNPNFVSYYRPKVELNDKKVMTIAQQLNIKDFPFMVNDNNGKNIYMENCNGYWIKREYDNNGNEIYFENSDGYIDDKRPKPVPEYTMEELVDKLGHNFKIKK